MAKNLDDATAEIERVADAIMAAEYMLVCAGPTFDDASSDPFDSEYCVSNLIEKPNKFMGFWGAYYNEYLDKVPHEGYNIVSKFRDKLFSADDVRRRGKKTKGDTGEEDQFARFMVYTGHIGNSFQKCGIPDQEMMEVCGNITQWQCGVVPVCCPRTFGIERGFKFFIDPLTKDALPIKYVPPKPLSDLKKFRMPLLDSDDEEEAFRANAEKDANAVKGATAEEKARRLLRHRNHARTVRITAPLQVIDHRFPDMFTGFVEHVGGSLETYTFDDYSAKWATGGSSAGNAAFEEAQQRNAAAAEGGGGGKKSKDGKEAAPPPPPKKCAEPTRCSHLLAHVNAIDRGMYEDHRGHFTIADPDRWRSDRDAGFLATSKGTMTSEMVSVSSKREKVVKYNISLTHCYEDGSEGGRTYVVPADIRDKLLRPYGEAEGAEEERAIQELMTTEMRDWTQSMNSWYFFSHVPLARTQQEPVHNSFSDFVKVEVPPPSFIGEYNLPAKGVISLVCETVILAEGDHNPRGNSAAAVAASHLPPHLQPKVDVPPNPYLYTNNVWQFVGYIDTTRVAEQLNTEPTRPGTQVKDAFEYILEGRKGHVLHIGSLRSKPQQITYIHLEVPHGDWDTQMQPFASRLVRPAKDSSGAAAGATLAQMLLGSSASDAASAIGTASYYDRQDDGSDKPKAEELVPTLNHILCQTCREIARPYVLMSGGGGKSAGTKDDGFATSVMNIRNKAFKAWEKGILDALKQDHNKSIVMLEIGADRKMDPSRQYSEKTFKLLKTAKCTFVRICPYNLETKAKSGNADNANQVAIACNPVLGLQALERAVNERIKKVVK